jgi:lipase chaperone LimK
MKTANLTFAGATSLFVAVFLTFYAMQPDSQPERIKLRPADHSFDFVRSMEGTTSDGKVSQDNSGDLQINAELRLMFDYYLAATGEKKLPEIQAEIEKMLDLKLGAKAAGQAKDLLGRYLQYKQALFAIESNAQNISAAKSGMSAAVRQRWAAMQQARSRYFSDRENQALFGFDDAYDNDALARMEINENTSLSPEQKLTQIKALDDALPAALKEEKAAPYQVIRLEEQAQNLRAQGASDDDIYRMRSAATSPEAASRLAQLDKDEANWKSRIQQYLDQKNRINTEMAMHTDIEKQAALQLVRNQYFNADEQRRLPAYE